MTRNVVKQITNPTLFQKIFKGVYWFSYFCTKIDQGYQLSTCIYALIKYMKQFFIKSRTEFALAVLTNNIGKGVLRRMLNNFLGHMGKHAFGILSLYN